MHDDYTPEDEGRAKVAAQIEKAAKQQHLTGQRRDAFTDSVSLCSSCKWSSSRRQASRNTKRIECGIFNGPCPEDINECSEYVTVTSLTLGQMAEIAYIIDISPKKQVGFHGDTK